MDWSLRLANDGDIPALEALIERSVRELQAAYYSAAQMDGALGSVFGVDRQLIRDQTYFVAEQDGAIIACGGWSKRASLFGSDAARAVEDALLDPLQDAARIRAFFVHPEHARRGPGGAFLSRAKRRFAPRGFARSNWSRLCPACPSIGRSTMKPVSATKCRS